MQTKRERIQSEMMLLPPLDSFIPQDHFLRRLNKVLDLSFIHEAVRDRYCQDNGRPSIDPEVVIRLFLLQAIEGIGQVRELMRQVQVNLAYRWFIGYELDEKLPDHSTLSKALDRFGDNIFNELFDRSIAQCKQSGLIEGKVLHVDATTIRADIDRNRVNKPDSSDRDARYGKFPGRRVLPGYKQQTVVDNNSRVVVGLSVMPANESEHNNAVEVVDSALNRLGSIPEAVCADAAYSSGSNCRELKDRGIRFISPPPKAKNRYSDRYYTIDDFEYDKQNDVFICPAGKRLTYMHKVKDRPNHCRYGASRSVCRKCCLKDKCTASPRRTLKVSFDHEALKDLRADSQTDSFKRLYRSRAPMVEGIFAEAKQWHGLGRAWRRGLSKMKVQCLLIAAVMNFKRLSVVLRHFYSILTNGITDLRKIIDITERFYWFERLNHQMPSTLTVYA